MASCERPVVDNWPGRDDINALFKIFEIDGKRWCLPSEWEKQGEGFRNFQAKPDDVWIVTQPRSGTTLTQELIWLLVNNLDFETAKKFYLFDRCPEVPISLFPFMWKNCKFIRPSVEDPKILESVPIDTNKNSYEVYANAKSPRVLKTHLALSVHKGIMDSGCKIVYVVRNPKDCLVSQARFAAAGPKPLIRGGVQNCMRHFIADEASPWGPYWEHIKEAWNLRHHPNLLFLYYEELRMDLPASIKKVAKFLGKSYNDDEIAQVAAHLDIDTFRKNPMVNELPGCEEYISSFIGNGRVQGWQEIVTPEFETEIDRWIEKNTKDLDIVYPYNKK